MGTSATIAVVKSDGSVIQTSVHYDGYLSGVGKILLEEYTNQDRIELLVSLGEMSSLGKFITPEITALNPIEFQVHNYEHPMKDVTVYYGRDRGETGTEPEEYKDVQEFFDEMNDEEFNYLFIEGKWIYWTTSKSIRKYLTVDSVVEE